MIKFAPLIATGIVSRLWDVIPLESGRLLRRGSLFVAIVTGAEIRTTNDVLRERGVDVARRHADSGSEPLTRQFDVFVT
jgi:hypothetical protein